MSDEILVDWRQLLPLADAQWEDTFFSTIEDLQRSQSVRIRTVADPAVDLLFLPYLAAEHQEVVDRLILENQLTKVTGIEDAEVALVACANCSPILREGEVKKLLGLQGQLVAAHAEPFRIESADALSDVVRRLVAQVSRRKRLMAGSFVSVSQPVAALGWSSAETSGWNEDL